MCATPLNLYTYTTKADLWHLQGSFNSESGICHDAALIASDCQTASDTLVDIGGSTGLGISLLCFGQFSYRKSTALLVIFACFTAPTIKRAGPSACLFIAGVAQLM